jgi:hypothetical protein
MHQIRGLSDFLSDAARRCRLEKLFEQLVVAQGSDGFGVGQNQLLFLHGFSLQLEAFSSQEARLKRFLKWKFQRAPHRFTVSAAYDLCAQTGFQTHGFLALLEIARERTIGKLKFFAHRV